MLGGTWFIAATAIPVGERAYSRQVERGRYLVKTTGCNDCHTPGYLESAGRIDESRWLVGSSLGWQGPWGTTYPPNLRLLTQRLTPEEWLLVARREMRPPMPWFALREMTDADLLAIYHFTRSLGPAGEAAPAFVPAGEAPKTAVVKVPG
ncbi:MAG: cytochrome C [Steroidobacteraceae bacterium]|nr:cytochrome C [Steroidobacteraceae bacterium]